MTLSWTYESQNHSVIQIPLCVRTVQKTLTVSLTSSANLSNAFLYTDGDFSGIMTAKLSTQQSYKSIGAYSLAPTCFLGDLEADTAVSINIRITFPESDTWKGEKIIPIYVGNGDNIEPGEFDQDNIFWRDDSTDDPFSWCSSTEEADSDDTWIGSAT